MKSLLVICQDKKEQNLIKTFTGGKYRIRFYATYREGIQGAIRKPVDLILIDLDKQQVTLEQFIKDLRTIHVYTPVIASSSADKKYNIIPGDQKGLAGYIRKPGSQSWYLKTIEDVLLQQALIFKKEMEEGRESVELFNSELLIGFRKEATIYKISKLGMVLFLPTSIALESRILFKGTPLYKQLGIDDETHERVELLVSDCTPTANNNFKITARFTDDFIKKSKNKLDHHVEQHAQKCISVSRSAPNILIVGDSHDIRQSYRFYFKDSDYEAIFANNADDTFEKMQEFRTDLLILDTNHLETLGKQIVEGLKQRKMRMPLMLVTGDGNPQLLQTFVPKVQDVLIRPVNGQVIKKRIKQVFERWKNEVKVEQEIGKNLGVNLKTRILVAFRDKAVIRRVRKDGLLILKHHPIVPTTSVYCKVGVLFKNMGFEKKNVNHLELIVSRCDPLEDDRGFRILSKFINTPLDIQKLIEAFVDGVPSSQLALRMSASEQPTKKASMVAVEEKEVEQTPGLVSTVSEIQEGKSGMVSSVSEVEEVAEVEPDIVIPIRFNPDKFEKALPRCKIEPVLAENVKDAYFPASGSQYVRQLYLFRKQIAPFQINLQQVVDRIFPKIESTFSHRKMDHVTLRREQSVTYWVHAGNTGVYFQLGAILTTIPKGMGISASLVEDKYRYDPYFAFGVPVDSCEELGDPIGVRTINGQKVSIYDTANPKVLTFSKIIIDLLKKL